MWENTFFVRFIKINSTFFKELNKMDPIQKDTKTTSGKTPNLFFQEPARLSPSSDGIQECPVCWEKIESDFAAVNVANAGRSGASFTGQSH